MADTLDPVERENEIMETLQELAGSGLDFIVVGGYGVSAYRHRFSVDADVVIRAADRPGFEGMLRKRGYRLDRTKQIGDLYSSEYARYERAVTRTSVDLLVGGVSVRQTGASFGFELLKENSQEMEIKGIEKSVKALVPTREMLIAMKLHSGRLTDLRDVAALAFGLDIAKIESVLFRGGDLKALKGHLELLGSLIEKQDFRDSFKGVFMEKNYSISIPQIRRLAGLAGRI
jgi:hypothetical protein